MVKQRTLNPLIEVRLLVGALRFRSVQALAFLGSLCYDEGMLETKEKQKIIEQTKLHPSDTGSPEVQISLLSEEIRKLLLHLKKHAKDFHSKRGLLKMVAKRRTLLAFLKRENEKRYNGLMKKIGLKK